MMSRVRTRTHGSVGRLRLRPPLTRSKSLTNRHNPINAANTQLKVDSSEMSDWRVVVTLTRHNPRRTGLGALHHPAPSLSHPQGFRV